MTSKKKEDKGRKDESGKVVPKSTTSKKEDKGRKDELEHGIQKGGAQKGQKG